MFTKTKSTNRNFTMNASSITFFLIVATKKILGKKNLSNSEVDQEVKVHVRLKGSDLSYGGRVEISKDGRVWGTICDKDWNLNDARVICRQLSFSNEVAAVPMAGFGAGSGAIFLNHVDCKGSERSLLQCEHDSWKNHMANESCDHSMDVGVLCSPHKRALPLIIIIVLGCVTVTSCLVNIWLTYYVCYRVKWRRTGQLTAVEHRTVKRKYTCQNGLENFAYDIERVGSCRPSSSPENIVVTRYGVNRGRSGKKRKEDAQTSVAACQQGEQPHVYQSIESCVFDPPSQAYVEILESVNHRQTNQQPPARVDAKSPKRPSYSSLSPRLQAATKNAKDIKGDQEEKHLYQKLVLRKGSSDIIQVSSTIQGPDGTGTTNIRTSIPDYVEIISDEDFEANTKRIQSSTQTLQETTVAVHNAYETLTPPPVPVRNKEGTETACTAFQEVDQSVKREGTDEAGYVELLNDNEAGEKENATTKELKT